MSTNYDPKVAKLLADLATAQAALSAHLLGSSAHLDTPEMSNFVPLKVAAAVWGISQDAALRRARRGHGKMWFGRWYFHESVVYLAKTGGAA